MMFVFFSKSRRWKFSLKFRVIFENFEKDQKKTDVFILVGPLKVGNFMGPLKMEIVNVSFL